MVREQPGLMDAQQQIHLAGRSLDILELHPAEEGSDSSQVDWGKISCDVGNAEGEDVLDLPSGCMQGDPVGKGLPLLGLLPSHLEVLGDRSAR